MNNNIYKQNESPEDIREVMKRNVSLLWDALNDEQPDKYPLEEREEFVSFMTDCALSQLYLSDNRIGGSL